MGFISKNKDDNHNISKLNKMELIIIETDIEDKKRKLNDSVTQLVE